MATAEQAQSLVGVAVVREMATVEQAQSLVGEVLVRDLPAAVEQPQCLAQEPLVLVLAVVQ